MKQTISTLFLAVTIITATAQDKLKEAQEYLNVPGGVQNVDKKVLKEPDPQAFPYIALKFRTASVQRYITVKGRTALDKDQVVEAPTYAILSGVDSLLCQEITNEFTQIFLAKMKETGITIIDFAKVMEGKTYKKFLEEPAERNFNDKDFGTAHVYTNDNMPFFYQGGMKIFKFAQDNEGGAATLRLTVDFVQFETEGTKTKINAGGEVGYNYTASALPMIKITSDVYHEGRQLGGPITTGGLVLGTKKYLSAQFIQAKPVTATYEALTEKYDEKSPKFADKSAFAQTRGKIFGGQIQMGTFVLTANRDAYKKTSLEALAKYTDYVLEIIKSYREK